MREIDFVQLTNYVKKQKSENFSLNMNNTRSIKISQRSRDEREALTLLAKASWDKSVKDNKFKKLGVRVFYYDYR